LIFFFTQSSSEFLSFWRILWDSWASAEILSEGNSFRGDDDDGYDDDDDYDDDFILGVNLKLKARRTNEGAESRSRTIKSVNVLMF